MALSTSKIIATRDSVGAGHVRGTDLIQSEADIDGHGTSVSGILVGGIREHQRYVGVAPDAEILVADIYNSSHLDSMFWARSLGADVMLHEIGGWVLEFLDGSSPIEQAIDQLTGEGIVQVVPAGNLGGSNRHTRTSILAGSSEKFPFTITPSSSTINVNQVWLSMLWRNTANSISFSLTEPGGTSTTLPATTSATWQTTILAGHIIWYIRTDSARGTAKYDIAISNAAVTAGNWTLTANNTAGNAETVHGYTQCAYSDGTNCRWSGGIAWAAFTTDDETITLPSTADKAITVANYHPEGYAFVGITAGDIAVSSGVGPRIDGIKTVDIAAPGSWMVVVQSKDSESPSTILGKYDWFGGTSAAGPHVAGATALLKQMYPDISHDDIRQHLIDNARADGFTGIVPNNTWGFGKLDVLAAVGFKLDVNIIGNGTVTKNPDQPDYTAGTNVTLTPIPEVGWVFVGWSGDLSGSANPVTITMDSNKTITATFEQSQCNNPVTPPGATIGFCHQVQSTDTLYGLGRLYRVDPFLISRLNQLYSPNLIYDDQSLFIPAKNEAGTGPNVYLVKPGDTLASVADQCRLPISTLAKANGLDPAAPLSECQALIIPVRPYPPPFVGYLGPFCPPFMSYPPRCYFCGR